MKREVAHNAITLMEKAHQADVTALSAKVENDYPTIKQFHNLQSTVGQKAEWLDVNDLTRDQRSTNQMLQEAISNVTELKTEFKTFATFTEEKHSSSVDQASKTEAVLKKLEKILEANEKELNETNSIASRQITDLRDNL